MKHRLLILFVLMSLAVNGLSACAPGGTEASNGGVETKLKGTLSISGAFALYPLMTRWAEEFQKVHPDVQFDISAGGAGKGMTDAVSGAVDIGMVSREV